MGYSGAVDYDSFISKSGRKWTPAPIRHLLPLEEQPGMISFLTGKPNPVSFPFRFISFGLADSDEVCTLEGQELYDALQYLNARNATLPELTEWWETFEAVEHNRRRGDGWRVSAGAGSLDLLTKVFAALINPGEPVLLETPVYPGVLSSLTQTDCVPIELKTDHEGIVPDTLETLLSNWKTLRPSLPFPKVLYVQPSGQNPSGYCTGTARKKRIMEIVRRWNLLLVEDEAYGFVYYGEGERPASFFELDEGEGRSRVLRLDSMSKILSAGLRVGFLTGPPAILDIVDKHTANTQLQSSSTTQALVLKLFKAWGISGLKAHCAEVAAFYKSQRDMFEAAAKEHLEGLATWVTPTAGMFLYLRLDLSDSGESDVDTYHALSSKAIEKGILVTPGTTFMPSGAKSSYARVSFSLASKEKADEGFRRLKEVILEVREERRLMAQNNTAAC
ncbi:PLP-dependent transferase [Atractiella rhizophila]|nr:PLP-dependent transferase [Atractiella rhizophila]